MAAGGYALLTPVQAYSPLWVVLLNTLGGALGVAGQLPGRLGLELVAAARTAFSHGLDTAAAGACVAMVVAAVLSARFFRGLKVRQQR